MSEEKTTENIYTALLKFQESDWLVGKDSDNPYFRSKYADLEAVSKVCRKALNQAGIVLTQIPLVKENLAGCVTILTHAKTGSEIQNELLLPLSKNDAQAVGSCITYARRYALCSILGLVAADEDDDGNAASGNNPQVKGKDAQKPASKPGTPPKTKDAPIAPVATQPLKVPFSEDNIPDAYTTTKQVFPDSQEIKINFKYDIDQCPADKIPTIEKYLNEMEKQGYVYLDQRTGVIESEIELPKLKNYQTNLT